MIRAVRLFIKNTPLLNKTIYRFAFWFANDVLKIKQRLIRKYGYEALAKIIGVANKCGVCCFPNYGTLLGFIRDHGFIKHDPDLDFSLMPGSHDVHKFYLELEKSGFFFERFITIDDVLHEFTVRYKEFAVDFYQEHLADGHEDYVDYMANRCGDFWPVIRFPVPRGMKNCIIHGVVVPVPENANEILDALYGNWHVVVKQWDESCGPNVRKDYSSHQWFLSRDRRDWIEYLRRTCNMESV